MQVSINLIKQNIWKSEFANQNGKRWTNTEIKIEKKN